MNEPDSLNDNSSSSTQEESHDNADETSKTALKKQATELQQLGLRLSQLKPHLLDQFDLPEKLRAAIADHQRFNSNEAKRRQLQYVGKLMRNVPVEPILHHFDLLDGVTAQANRTQHELEEWREKLLANSKEITHFLDRYPNTDRQALRQNIKRTTTQMSKSPDSPPARKAYRDLFRHLRDIHQQHDQDNNEPL